MADERFFGCNISYFYLLNRPIESCLCFKIQTGKKLLYWFISILVNIENYQPLITRHYTDFSIFMRARQSLNTIFYRLLSSITKVCTITLIMPKEEKTSLKSEDEIIHSHHEVKTLLSWKAKGRPFKRRSREFFFMIVFITLALCIILFLFKEYVLILAVLSIAFLGTVLATAEPYEVEHRITTQGVITGEHAHLYKELYDFWFDEKDGNKVLYIRTYAILPGVLSLLLGDMDEKVVRDVLVKHIPYREVVKKTFMDKASNWLSKNFPLESKG